MIQPLHVIYLARPGRLFLFSDDFLSTAGAPTPA